VERPFAYMKQVLQYQRCSYYDIGRNRFEFIICALIYNIRRLVTLSTWSKIKTKNYKILVFLKCQWIKIFVKWFRIIWKTYCLQIILQKN
jgi:hypothetical protein